MRYSKKDRRLVVTSQNWTQQQDIFLIENNEMPLEQLQQSLPYSADEIMQRRKILGLLRRHHQLHKLNMSE